MFKISPGSGKQEGETPTSQSQSSPQSQQTTKKSSSFNGTVSTPSQHAPPLAVSGKGSSSLTLMEDDEMGNDSDPEYESSVTAEQYNFFFFSNFLQLN